MTHNREQFSKLVSNEKSNTLKNIKERKKNRAMLRESKDIAFKVLMRLDELQWKQKDLAEKLGVSPQQITKIVSGKENLTLETLVKLQNVLEIPFLFSFFEHKMVEIMETHKIEVTQDYEVSETVSINITPNTATVVQLSYEQEAEEVNEYEYFPLAQ